MPGLTEGPFASGSSFGTWDRQLVMCTCPDDWAWLELAILDHSGEDLLASSHCSLLPSYFH